jgi:hypothetical protein
MHESGTFVRFGRQGTICSHRTMRPVLIIIVGLLLVALGYSVKAVARLDNYRYANFVWPCVDGYDVKTPVSRVLREDCLMRSKARAWPWDAAHGLNLL